MFFILFKHQLGIIFHHHTIKFLLFYDRSTDYTYTIHAKTTLSTYFYKIHLQCVYRVRLESDVNNPKCLSKLFGRHFRTSLEEDPRKNDILNLFSVSSSFDIIDTNYCVYDTVKDSVLNIRSRSCEKQSIFLIVCIPGNRYVF